MKNTIEQGLNFIFGYIPEYQFVFSGKMDTHQGFKGRRPMAACLHHEAADIHFAKPEFCGGGAPGASCYQCG
jgi:hypothetical protein